MADFSKTFVEAGQLNTETLREEIAADRRVGQYTTDIYPPSKGGGGGGQGSVNNLWNQLKQSYEASLEELTRDIEEIKKSHQLGYLNGAQKDYWILETFNEFEDKLSTLTDENHAIIQAKAETAPSTVADWLDSAQDSLDIIKADEGALEEPRKFRKDQSAESVAQQDDLLERKEFFRFEETTDQDGVKHQDIAGYTYDNGIVTPDGKINKSLAQNDSVVIDIWTGNGYTQTSAAQMKDDEYVYDVDPYTGQGAFYQTEVETVTDETSPFGIAVKDRYVYMKGANGVPIKIKYEQNDDGTRNYYYNNEQPSQEPLALDEDQTKATLMGLTPEQWQAYPDKDAATTLFNNLSNVPQDGGWVEGRDGMIFRVQDGKLRPVNNQGILDSYKQNGEFFDTTKKMPTLFFGTMEMGDELRDWGVENQEANDLTNAELQTGEDETSLMDRLGEYSQRQEDKQAGPVRQSEEDQAFEAFLAPSQNNIKASFYDNAKPQQQEQPQPEDQKPPKEEKQGLFNNLFRGIFF